MLDAQGQELYVGDKVVVTKPLWGSLMTMSKAVVTEVNEKTVVCNPEHEVGLCGGNDIFKASPKSKLKKPQTFRILKI
jgi:hypothetical protein